MNDSQMLTVALATVPTMFTVLVGILLNNARLSDVNSRLGEFRSHMDARFNRCRPPLRRNEGNVAYRASPRRSTPV